MSVVTVTADVDATPEQVWRVVADPHNLPRWSRHISRVEGVPEGGLRAGSSYTTVVSILGARLHGTSTVEEIEPPQYSRIHLDGAIEATIETRLTSLPGGRTRLEHRVEYRFKGGPVGGLAARAIRLLGANAILRRGIAAQKRQVEGSR